MDVATIKTHVKRVFGDESGVQLTDTDILMWANAALENFVISNEGIMEATGFASSVANQMDYTLPTDIIVLESVSFKDTGQFSFFPLRGKTLREFDEYIYGWDGTTQGSGIPVYYRTRGVTLSLWPPPLNSGSNNIKIYYRRRPAILVADEDIPEVPLEYHNAIVDYVLSRAHTMDEDYEAAQFAANRVDTDVNKLSERESSDSSPYYPMMTVQWDDQG